MFLVGAAENFVLYKVPEFFSAKESSATSHVSVELGNKIIIFKRPQTSIAMTYSLSDFIKYKDKKRGINVLIILHNSF